jgi:hypothetical protein
MDFRSVFCTVSTVELLNLWKHYQNETLMYNHNYVL